jgi:hypothetical protein
MASWVKLEVNKKDDSVVQKHTGVVVLMFFRVAELLMDGVVTLATECVFLDDIMRGVYRYVDIEVPVDDPYAATSFVLWKMLSDAKLVHAVHVPPACDANLDRIIEFLAANPVGHIIHPYCDDIVATRKLLDSVTTGNVHAESLELRFSSGHMRDYNMDNIVFALVFNKKCNIKTLKCVYRIWFDWHVFLNSPSRGTWIRHINLVTGVGTVVPGYDALQYINTAGVVKSAMLVLRECASIKRIQNNVGCVVHRLPLELIQMTARFLLMS